MNWNRSEWNKIARVAATPQLEDDSRQNKID